MAKIYLANGESFKVVNNNSEVIGTDGTENVIIESGAQGVTVNSTVERTDLAGNVADFQFKQGFGSNIEVLDAQGNVVMTLGDVDGKQLVFADGAVALTYTATGSVLSVGGTAITTTAAAVTPATVDTNTTSQAASTDGGTTDPVAGQTFTLTTGADISGVMTGSASTTSTAGDDTINATQSTYTGDDVINGGAGTDALNVAITANSTNTATVVGVENVNVITDSAADLSFDAAGIVGVGTTLTLSNTKTGGATGGTISNAASGMNVVAGAGVSAAFTVEAAGTTLTVDAGSATTANVGVDSNVASATALTVSGDSLTAINLEGTAAATDSATITASGSVTLNTNSDGTAIQQVENLSLSGNGAAVAYTLADANDNLEEVTFTGDQNVTLAGSAAVFNGEVFTDSTTAGTTVLSVTANGTADLTKAAVDVIDLADTTGNTYNVADNATVRISGAGTTTVLSQATSATGTQSLNATLNANTTKLTVSDFETVNLDTTNAATTAASPVVLTDLVASSAAGTVVNVTGDENLTITNTSTTDSVAKKIDAANLTGDLVVSLGANLADVTGGAGDDTFNAVAQDFTVVGGDGVDTLAFAAAADLTTSTVSFSGIETVQLDTVTDGAENVQMKSSVVSGQSFVLKGTGTADTLTVKADAASVDLSGITVDTATAAVAIDLTDVAAVGATIQGSAGADGLSASTNTGVITVDGGAGNDNLVTGVAADSITAGEGADIVMGGKGNDTIILTETTAAIDDVVLSAVADNGVDTITGFAAGSGVDTISIVKGDTTKDSAANANDIAVFGTEATTLVTGGATFTLATSTADNSVIELTTTLDDDVTLSASSTGTDLLQALSSDNTAASGVTVNADTNKAFMVVYQGDNAFLWHLAEDADGNAEVAAADISLVGVFNGVDAGAFAAGDFIIA